MKKSLLFFVLTLTVIFSALTASATETPDHITVAQPITNIVGDISAVRVVNSSAELASLVDGDVLPATAVFTADESLAVTNDLGVAYSTVSEVIAAMNYNVIPAFRVETKEAAVAVGTWLNGNFSDSFLISSSPEVLSAGRAVAPLVGGVIDYTESYFSKTELTKDDCIALRKELYKNMATVAILPGELCKADTVQYLYDRQVGVWASISDEPSIYEIFGAINCGAIGVISDDTDSVLDAAMSLPEMTMTRLPLNIAHRGFADTGIKRNHYSGIIYSYEVGGKTVEFDVYMTAAEENDPGDGSTRELVINHDSYLDTDETNDGVYYKIASTPWSTLQNVKTVSKDSETGEILYEYDITTLESVFRYFAGSDDGVRKNDAMLIVELKNGSDILVVEKTWELIEKYGLYDIVTVITFNTDFVARSREVCPEMPFAQLSTVTLIYEGNTDAAISSIKELTGAYNAVYEPCLDSTKVNIADNSARAALKRGIFMFTWGNETKRVPWYLMSGTSALTNDWVTNLNSYPKNIKMVGVPETKFVAAGDVINLSALLDTYKTIGSDASDFTVEILEGADLVSVNGTKITFGNTIGKVTFALSYKKSISKRVDNDLETYPAMEYTVYSDPVTVEITDFNGAVKTEGFSIRLKDYNGLRTIFSFDKNKNAVFEKQGYELLEYGAVVVAEALHKKEGSVTIDGETRELTTSGKKIAVWKDGEKVGSLLGEKDGIVSYCVAVINYKAYHADNVYYAAYSIYKDPDGKTVVTVKDYGVEGYNAINLYQTTLDMYINGAINASNTDEVAVWNTLLTGVVTLNSSEYVKTVTDMDGNEFGDTFIFKDVYNMASGDVTNKNIKITLFNDYRTGEYVAVYRGTGKIANANTGYSQFYHKTSRTKMSHPKLTEATSKKISTYILDDGITGTSGNYSLRGSYVKTVVCAETVVNIAASTFYETFALTSVYQAKSTGAMQENETGLVDLSFITNLNTNNLLFKLGTAAGVTKVHLPAKFVGTTSDTANILGTAFISESNGTTRYKITKVWCGDTKEPEDGVIDLSGATGIVEVMGSSLSAMSKACDSYILILPDSCTKIDAICRSECISEVRQATYNEALEASLKGNQYIGTAKYCDLNGVEHTNPLATPGDIEVDDSTVFH